MNSRSFFHGGIVAAMLGLWLSGAAAARAEDVQVTAAFANTQAVVGEPVDFTITVTGAAEAAVAENINVDGLTITYVGPNSQTEISFGSGFGGGSHIQRSVIYTYTAVPQRAGDFVIPAQRVVVDGKTYATQPVDLKVDGTAASGGGAPGGGGQQSAEGSGKLYYAEIVAPRNRAYVGEALPFEIRLYVDTRVRAQLEEMPEITAEGCTLEKTTKPEQTGVTRNGQQYVMVTYKSAVTPAKAGPVRLGPVTVQAQAQLPERRRRRAAGNPLDDPFFQNPFFDDAFQMMSQPQQIKIEGDPVALTVLPLPVDGQPRSFAGAVGDFTMTTAVKPSTVVAGDPVTVTVKIAGRGDFDRVLAPQIADPDGWRTYPPSSKFDGDDDVGISGTKTFEMAVIPQTKKTASPALEWSYFDPLKERYVTLREKGLPINIEGEIQAAAAPVTARPATAPTQAAPDILYIRADSAGWGATFAPLYTNRLFWEAQGAPLLALVAFVGFQVARKRAADEQARVLARLRKEKEAALAAMQRRDVPESELYQAAARAMRLEAAIQTGRAAETLDGSEVANARILDEAMQERVRRVFDRQAEALYAGTAGGRSAASLDERMNALETVKGYENAKPA